MNAINEDHLLVVIDSFVDFSNHVFVLGYDLRIDAHSYCRFPLHAHFQKLEPQAIYQIEKNLIESSKNSRGSTIESSFYKIRKISEEELNPIEKIYYTHFNKKKTLSPNENLVNNANLSIHVGIVKEIIPVASVIGASLDLVISFPEFSSPITTRTQNLKYQVQQPAVALIKKIKSSQGEVINVLGLKDLNEVSDYLKPDFLEKRNLQILAVDYR